MLRQRMRFTRVGLALGLLLLVFIAAGTGAGCRDKANPVSPSDTGAQGVWRIQLFVPQVMYRGPQGHVDNDTIGVRVYDPTGTGRANIQVRVRCSVSVDSVGPVVHTRLDTLTRDFGSDLPIIYWGTGGVDGHETVTGFAINGPDTLAATTVSFKVVNGAVPQ